MPLVIHCWNIRIMLKVVINHWQHCVLYSLQTTAPNKRGQSTVPVEYAAGQNPWHWSIPQEAVSRWTLCGMQGEVVAAAAVRSKGNAWWVYFFHYSLVIKNSNVLKFNNNCQRLDANGALLSHKRIQRQQRKIRKVEVQPSVKDENSPISVLRVELSKTLALAKYEAVDQYCNNPPRLLEGSGNITLFLWQKTWVVVAKQYWYEG